MVLLMLATAFRVDDVQKLSIEFQVHDSVMQLSFLAPRKCPKRNVPVESFLLKRFPEDRVCPVAAILHFIDLSEEVRAPGVKQLFIHSKGGPATVPTLRRWTSELLKAAGIEATAGSCRSAAASRAAKNLPVDEILSTAGWACESTFRKFYARDVLPARSLLISE